MAVRMKYGLLAILSAALLTLPMVNGSLSISVSIENPEIYPSESQTLVVTTNEKGIGVLLVIQPSNGTPWMDYLEEHQPMKNLWNMLSNSTKTEISEKVGQKIVSFALIRTDTGGENVTLSFPEDFKGINGDPSTTTEGEYKAILAFLSYEHEVRKRCHLFEIGFDCVSWPVIPELPPGLLVVFFAAITLSLTKLHRKLRP